MKTGIELIAAERARQLEVEGWTPEHDSMHLDGDLARAGICYAAVSLPAHLMGTLLASTIMHYWPWDETWWKPTLQIRDLTKAGALIAAEIDRLQRKGAAPL